MGGVCVRLGGGWCLYGCVGGDVRTREWLYTLPVQSNKKGSIRFSRSVEWESPTTLR